MDELERLEEYLKSKGYRITVSVRHELGYIRALQPESEFNGLVRVERIKM